MPDDDARVVCLVDDDLSLRKSLGRLLESAGYQVLAFAESEVFLKYIATHFVPVVVLDLWMGSMSGMELLTHLCARSPQTRVIFITGREDRAAEATVMEAGASAFLLKPLDDQRFLAAVESAFTNSAEK
jgi:FixJ family two-component response regulator